MEGQTLRATHINVLNDSKEYQHGVDILVEALGNIKNEQNEKVIREIKKRIKKIYDTDRYVICFSRDGNLLSQWRAYTNNGKGVSIGFDRRSFRFCFQELYGDSLIGKNIL